MLSKKNKGITLVALVITIIILLILAGISISALTNTGIFQKAQDAEGKSKLADAKESMTLLLHEWQVEHVTSDKTLETFLGEKVADSTIESYNKLDNENYEVYIKGYVGVIDSEGNLVEDVQKAGPRPTISNVKITTDGTTEVADNSQKPGTKLKINFSSSIENGTIKSVTPAVQYETNGTETEITFTIVGTVDGTDYTTKKTISVASKYKQIEKLTAEKLNTVLSTTENKTLQDAKGNIITVPAGFKIVSNADTNNATTVDKGIVIEDATSSATAGSQFVWIPVGTITKEDGTTVEINLDRYTFDGNGKPTPRGENVINSYYSETASKGNTVAKSITNFKNSVTTNEGYYIGRYEARKNESETITEVGTDTICNTINQPTAATKAQKMYDNTHPFTSDLMNSYAWDTATLFLQSCGTNNKYSRKTSVNSSFATTGTNSDIQCNVHDMASNVREWTTETSSESDYPCTDRGGYYDSTYNFTSIRNSRSTSNSDSYFGFRPLLYVNV